jgi:hypothetical protein
MLMARSSLAGWVVGLCFGAAWSLPAPAGAAVTLPGPPPVSQSAFKFEPAASKPVDNDQAIPKPTAPTAPTCTVTLAAPSNGAVTAVQNRINSDVAVGSAFKGDTICLTGTYRAPIHVRGKFSTALLTIASAPGSTAVFNLAGRPPTTADEDPNAHDNTDVGVVELGDSRDVEIYGLTIENWVTTSANFVPAGIYVTDRSDSGGTVSACFTRSSDHACSDIFLYRNTVESVENNAAGCGNGNINAFGIAVKAFGQDSTHVLQHLVIEDNTITRTATGQSETMTINGDIAYFLVAGNVITHVNNIGLDTIGWETGSTTASQARYGYLYDNQIADVDSTTNLSGYGHLVGGKCVPGDDAAAGLYVDGASYQWLNDNQLTDTNHGIELAVENNGSVAGAHADHLLLTRNVVSDGAGTTFSGSSATGHSYDAMMIDGGAGSPATVRDVYAHGNTLTNQSRFYNDGTWPLPAHGMPAAVVDLELRWQDVWLLGNTVTAGGSSDTLNPELSVDSKPVGSPTAGSPGVVIDCNTYDALSTSPSASQADNFDFSATGSVWGPLATYRAQNRMPTSELGLATAHAGWDADSAANVAPACPFSVPS